MISTTQDAHDRRLLEAEKRDVAELLAAAEPAAADARALAVLSRKQSEAIAVGDIDALIDALMQRDPIVKRLTEAQGKMQPALERLAARGRRLSDLGDEHVRVRTLLNELDDIITRVNIADSGDQTRLAQQRQRLSEQLADLASGSSARNAYQVGGEEQRPVFQDRRV